MLLRQLFDPETSTYTYLLADEDSLEAALIDPVQEQVERDMQFVQELGLQLRYVLETHVHADHVTAAGRIRELTGAKTVFSEAAGVGCADISVHDGDTLELGKHQIEVLATPGHTSGCVSYYVEGAVFTGDALLIRGCGRTDFQEGCASTLYNSVHRKLFSLPSQTLVYPGHDYRGRTVSTISEERRFNPRLGGGKSEAEFRSIMEGLKLAYPKRIDQALPANLRCGRSAPSVEGFMKEIGAEPRGDIYEVSPQWVQSRASKLGFTIVDVREPRETQGELKPLPDAELVPLATVTARAAGWDRDAPLVMVCRSGGRSGQATRALQKMGFQKVVNMEGGMLAAHVAPAVTAVIRF